MDPSSILMATGLQAVMDVGGALMQGEMDQDAANANANILRQNARQTGQQTVAAVEQQRREAAMEAGRQRAAIAQSGGGFGGSAADVMRQSATMAELDAMNIQYEGELRRRGLLAESRMQRFAGKQAKVSSYWKATSALISGGADYGSTAMMLGG